MESSMAKLYATGGPDSWWIRSVERVPGRKTLP